MAPTKAFILAAGFGKRLRPFTDNIPKPMVSIGQSTLLDRTINHLKEVGVNEFIVNTHYKADVIHNHLDDHENIHISYEEEILDTGGGIKKAYHHFNDEDFYVLSGDGLWSNGPDASTLERLAEAWDPKIMDILMLLQPIERMQATKGVGDYDLDNQGRATRSLTQEGRYMFTSIRINRSHIFQNTPHGSFSYLELMDKAQAQGRLYGLINDGEWYHISTPQDLESAGQAFEEK
jgi:MurNAc alpha-1-phosphate uridylyltransferase